MANSGAASAQPEWTACQEQLSMIVQPDISKLLCLSVTINDELIIDLGSSVTSVDKNSIKSLS